MKRVTELGLSDKIVDCGADWDGMNPLDSRGLVRHCDLCDHSVEQVFTTAELEAVLAAGGCVAICDEKTKDKGGGFPRPWDDYMPVRKGRDPANQGAGP